MMQITLREVLLRLDKFSWKDWGYVPVSTSLSLETECAVLDSDQAELGADDFTPLEAERLGMEEFLSVQDLKSIKDNLLSMKTEASPSDLLSASVYYFEHDAFLPESELNKLKMPRALGLIFQHFRVVRLSQSIPDGRKQHIVTPAS